jgi:hypothetical protein
MARTSHHVVPAPGGGWSVKRGGAEKASRHFDRKDSAISYARDVSRNQGSELYIHKNDGTIQRKDSHGGDRVPPRDRDTH